MPLSVHVVRAWILDVKHNLNGYAIQRKERDQRRVPWTAGCSSSYGSIAITRAFEREGRYFGIALFKFLRRSYWSLQPEVVPIGSRSFRWREGLVVG